MLKIGRPTTGRQLQHYLGFANYFREHIPLIARITAPLDKLRNETDLRALWTEDTLLHSLHSNKHCISHCRWPTPTLISRFLLQPMHPTLASVLRCIKLSTARLDGFHFKHVP